MDRGCCEKLGRLCRGVGWPRRHFFSFLKVMVFRSTFAPLIISSSKSASTMLTDVYPFLQASLMSHSHPLRLAVLRLLDSPLVQIPDGMAEVVKRCLQAEEASINVQGVRERVVRIGRVGSVVADEQGADVCVRWLIGGACSAWRSLKSLT